VAEYDVLVPQPGRKVEIPRSEDVDLSRSAVVDALCRKHGLVFKHKRGTPTRMVVSAAHHGCESITFGYMGGRA